KPGWIFLAIILLSTNACRSTSASNEGSLFVSGRIDGDTVDLSSKREGRIVELRFREGDSVKAGDVLAILSSAQDEARRDQQMAVIVSEQRRVDQLKRQLATYGEKIRQAQITVEQAQTGAPANVKEAEAKLAASKAELVRSEAEVQQSKIDA